MSKSEPKELTIEIAPHVKEQMEKDPEMAEVIQSFFATMHQAHLDVQTGKYATMEDAVEAITGNRPEKIDLDELELEDEDE